jgi:hypothetical protein
VPDIVIVVLVIAVPLVCGCIGGWIGEQRDRGTAGFWLGLFLGPLGWIIAALLDPTPEEIVRRERAVAAARNQAPDR